MGALSLEDVIAGLHRIFAVDDVNVDEVRQLLASYKSATGDWQKYAMFDPHRYTRNLVDKGNTKFNLMILCWGPAMGSSVHDHADAHCFVKMLSGRLLETQYEWPEKPRAKDTPVKALTTKSTCEYETDGVTYINDSMGLHRMENRSHTDSAVSMHVYIPPFAKCHTFDAYTGQRTTVRFTFWSVAGQRLEKEARLESCKQLAAVQCSKQLETAENKKKQDDDDDEPLSRISECPSEVGVQADKASSPNSRKIHVPECRQTRQALVVGEQDDVKHMRPRRRTTTNDTVILTA